MARITYDGNLTHKKGTHLHVMKFVNIQGIEAHVNCIQLYRRAQLLIAWAVRRELGKAPRKTDGGVVVGGKVSLEHSALLLLLGAV